MLIVDLYPASIFLNPAISSPIYCDFAQSRKLVLDLPEWVVHLKITAWKSWHALPQRNRGSLRHVRSVLSLAATCWRDCKTLSRASSSSLSSRMILWLLWKLSMAWWSDTLDWKANAASARSPEAMPIGSAILRRKDEIYTVEAVEKKVDWEKGKNLRLLLRQRWKLDGIISAGDFLVNFPLVLNQ